MNNGVCPSPAMLSAFLLGELPELELNEVARHLDQCELRIRGEPARIRGGRRFAMPAAPARLRACYSE